MSIHYFHCTDGVDLILDRDGHETTGYRETSAWARIVAARIVRSVPTYDEWADWAVYVYDAHGQVEIIPFEDDLLRCAA